MGEVTSNERRLREQAAVVDLDFRNLLRHGAQMYILANETEQAQLFDIQEMLLSLQSLTKQAVKRVALPSTFKPLFCANGQHMIVQEDGFYVLKTVVSGQKLVTALSLDEIERWLVDKGDDWAKHIPLSSWEEGI